MLSERLGYEPVYALNGTTEIRKWWSRPGFLDIKQIEDANGFRLPTLAEWNYAARGGQEYRYAGSDKKDEVAWYLENSSGATHEVGRKKPNGYGLYDMSGNVFELLWERYHQEHSFTSYFYKGGSWKHGDLEIGGGYYDLPYVREYDGDSPFKGYDDIGFRIVRTIESK